jgi:hypothetical protein
MTMQGVDTIENVDFSVEGAVYLPDENGERTWSHMTVTTDGNAFSAITTFGFSVNLYLQDEVELGDGTHTVLTAHAGGEWIIHIDGADCVLAANALDPAAAGSFEVFVNNPSAQIDPSYATQANVSLTFTCLAGNIIPKVVTSGGGADPALILAYPTTQAWANVTANTVPWTLPPVHGLPAGYRVVTEIAVGPSGTIDDTHPMTVQVDGTAGESLMLDTGVYVTTAWSSALGAANPGPGTTQGIVRVWVWNPNVGAHGAWMQGA